MAIMYLMLPLKLGFKFHLLLLASCRYVKSKRFCIDKLCAKYTSDGLTE